MQKNLADTIHKAADQLLADGDRVSVRNVRKYIGKGSFRDISRHLHAWRSSHSENRAPNPDASGFISLEKHDQALRELHERLEKDRIHLMLQTDAIRQGLAAPHLLKIERLEKKIAQLERKMHQAGLDPCAASD